MWFNFYMVLTFSMHIILAVVIILKMPNHWELITFVNVTALSHT